MVKWRILYKSEASARVHTPTTWLSQWSLPSPKTEATRPLPAILPGVTTVMLTQTLKSAPCRLHTACHLPGFLGALAASPLAGLCSATSGLFYTTLVAPTPLLTVHINLDCRF